ncbi:MAG: hypothetical protein N3A58_00485 [Spirochaetes bacterium]|nr:hypothetical protein [Spirochaetota bacterium]
MFLIYLFILILSFILKELNEIFSFIYYFFIVFFVFTLFYYFYALILLKIYKNKIKEKLALSDCYINSNICFSINLNFFFLSDIKLFIITDKDEIVIKYKNNKFQTSYFKFGLHKVKKIYLFISDFLFVFYIKLNLSKKNFYNYFVPSYYSEKESIEIKDNDFYKNIKKDFSSDDLIRDYFFGDDPRKILWRSYFLTDELKYRDKWISQTQKKICVVAIPEVNNELNKQDLKILNYVYIKILYFIYLLLKKNIFIKFNNNIFELQTFTNFQKELFDGNYRNPDSGDICFIFAQYFKNRFNNESLLNFLEKYNNFDHKIFIKTYDIFEVYERSKENTIIDILYKKNIPSLYYYYNKSKYKEIEKQYEKNFKIIF